MPLKWEQVRGELMFLIQNEIGRIYYTKTRYVLTHGQMDRWSII